jgi:hypothetical protein
MTQSGDQAMTFTDFVHLPPPVFLLILVMLWPAIWAAAGVVTALGGDIGRIVRRRRDFGRDAA